MNALLFGANTKLVTLLAGDASYTNTGMMQHVHVNNIFIVPEHIWEVTKSLAFRIRSQGSAKLLGFKHSLTHQSVPPLVYICFDLNLNKESLPKVMEARRFLRSSWGTACLSLQEESKIMNHTNDSTGFFYLLDL